MKYVSIDIETTGLNPETCDVLEIGAVIDTDPSVPIDKLPTYRFRVIQDTYRGEPYALSMHKELFADIAANRLNIKVPDEDFCNLYGKPGHFSQTFDVWLQRNGIPPFNFVVAGKNFANFDARFLSKMPGVGHFIKWHHRILDPGSMFVLPTDLRVPGTDECCERAGINPKDFPGKWHTAIFDSQIVVALVRKGLRQHETA